jgi:hypothetical protein
MEISTSSFGLFYCNVYHLHYSVLMVKVCKPVFLGGSSFFQWILDLIVSDGWIFAVFKALHGDGVCRCPFPLLSFQCVFISSTGNG